VVGREREGNRTRAVRRRVVVGSIAEIQGCGLRVRFSWCAMRMLRCEFEVVG